VRAVEPSVQVSSPKLLSKNHRGIAGVRGADESNVMKYDYESEY